MYFAPGEIFKLKRLLFPDNYFTKSHMSLGTINSNKKCKNNTSGK